MKTLLEVLNPPIKYIGGTDPYTENGELQSSTSIFQKVSLEDCIAEFATYFTEDDVRKLRHNAHVEELLQYYPIPKNWTLQELYDTYGEQLSEEERNKLKSLL